MNRTQTLEETETPSLPNTSAPPGVTVSSHWNPYAAGVALGLVLILALYISRGGLGASGATTRMVLGLGRVIAPKYMAQNAYWRAYDGQPIYTSWLVLELIGVFIGGLLAAITARRIKPGIERGAGFPASRRLVLAFAGGTIVGFASRLARGCTSGQALTGGATLAVGSWAFMFAVFAGGYATAWFVRRQWR